MGHKAPQPRLRGLFAEANKGAHHIRTTVHRDRQAPTFQRIACGPFLRRAQLRRRGQRWLNIAGFDVVPERRVDLVAIACLGLYAPRLKHHMSAKGLGINALVAQGFFDLAVTL